MEIYFLEIRSFQLQLVRIYRLHFYLALFLESNTRSFYLSELSELPLSLTHSLTNKLHSAPCSCRSSNIAVLTEVVEAGCKALEVLRVLPPVYVAALRSSLVDERLVDAVLYAVAVAVAGVFDHVLADGGC